MLRFCFCSPGPCVSWTGSEIVAIVQVFPEFREELQRLTTSFAGIFDVGYFTVKVVQKLLAVTLHLERVRALISPELEEPHCCP